MKSKRMVVWILALVGCMSLSAAKVTVIVADTAGSLVNEAKVKNVCTRQTYHSSVDGRAIIQADKKQLLEISASGYQTQRLRWSGKDTVMWVTLKYDKIKRSNKNTHLLGAGGSRRYRGGEEVMLYATMDHSSKKGLTTSAVASYESEEAAPVIAYGKGIRPSVPNNVSAGKLTAGEVNDFAKWYQWPGILDGALKDYIKDWRLAPRHRYTVQVTNRDGYPMASRAVSLLDKSGNTLFQAVTDNTGKAELWYQLINTNTCGKHAGLQIRVDDQTVEAKEWSEGINLVVVDEACEASETADVLFVVDATGSMGDEIVYLQAEMKDVIRRSQNAVEGLKIRTGAVFYRDYSDEYLTRISCLNDDIETTQRFIDKQQANGGGDYEEAVPEALKAALNVAGWDSQARTRILFLVLDAPCHQDSATIAMLHEQVLNAAAMGVRIVPVVCSGIGKSGELLMRELALTTNGTSFFLTDDSGIGHSHIKPTTDSLKVEHLNDMMVRTIIEYATMPTCVPEQEQEGEMHILPYIPNPFDPQDVENDPSIPHGETTLYLIDISGKLITIFEGDMNTVTPEQLKTGYGLSSGVYLIKAFYDGQWMTRKIIVR